MKRYSPRVHDFSDWGEMAEFSGGEYVKYEDVKALEEENEQLKKEIEDLYQDLAGESL
jgi:hypothetical protein